MPKKPPPKKSSSLPKPPPGRTYTDSQVRAQRNQLGAKSYTPSPAVKYKSSGGKGGIWRDSKNRVVGTSPTEDSHIQAVRKVKTPPKSTKR